MRGNVRIKNKQKSVGDKIIVYSAIGVGILTIILIGLLIYSKSLSDEVKEGTITLEQMANIAGNTTENVETENTESASSEIGKSIEEAENEIKNETNTQSTTNTSNTVKRENTAITNVNTNKKTNKTNSKTQAENKKELSFEKPVEGEILKEYAKDNLIYSETLKEWVTHFGIDIKADKTTVVKSAEAGTVKSIKNDPRYGLTIVIDHGDEMQTVYANLLTSEFVVEGEKVEKGQSIGTVGNTGVFEVADEPHLHFEILKDSIPQDPNIYLK